MLTLAVFSLIVLVVLAVLNSYGQVVTSEVRTEEQPEIIAE